MAHDRRLINELEMRVRAHG